MTVKVWAFTSDEEPMINPFRFLICAPLFLAVGCASPDNVGDAWMAGTVDLDGDGWFAEEDCDDLEAAANPGAVEVCGDAIDNDCDGEMGVCGMDWLIDLSDAHGTMVGERSGNHAGWSVAGIGDVNGDGFDDVAVGSWQDDTGGEYAGSVSIFHGPVLGSINLNRADAKLVGAHPGDHAGWAVSAAGDINRDGYADVIVGGYGAGEGAGAAWIVFGPIEGEQSLADADVHILGDGPYDYLGISVTGAGDLNHDGYPDIAVGAYGVDTPQYTDVGAVYVFHGPLMGVRSVSSADTTILGASGDDWFGYTVEAAGDATGDGHDDLLVGAPGVTRGGPDTGAAYLFRGDMSAVMTANGAHARLRGIDPNDRAGASVAAGDINGDAIADLVVGAWGSDVGYADAGAAFIVYGPVDGNVDLEHADATVAGDSAGDAFGFAVTVAEDINGDGLGDIIVGALQNDAGGPDSGSAYVIYGPVEVGVKNSAAEADVTLVGEVYNDRAGASVASAGDTDGDGYGDLLIGAHGNDSGGTDSGAAYLICGQGF
ncbi:MAG: hypothetical protein GY898_13660 [Proteobacteria bacterium]|nr:hypothetical protein [Pseudomonadota bacterium]